MKRKKNAKKPKEVPVLTNPQILLPEDLQTSAQPQAQQEAQKETPI